MKCEQARQALEDFRCGELPRKDAALIAAHIAQCTGCSQRLETLQSEQKVYADYRAHLDRILQVPPAMWSNVRTALEQQPRRGSFQTLLDALSAYLPASAMARQTVFAAALIVLSVGATLLAVRYYGRLNDRPESLFAQRSATGPQTLQGALQSIQRAEQEYLDAIQVLSAIVEKRKSTLDPQLVKELDANLRAIDESIEDTRRAYHAHPADAELAHYMLAAYNKKVELLQELAS